MQAKYPTYMSNEWINELFATHSRYFRNALVRANYSNLQEGVTETTIYLEQFFFPTGDDRRSYMILLGKYG